jgi:tetratricopeptide (TPR) repeat protein
MLLLESPLDAYRSDLARNRTREDFGGADTVWLLTAHCLARLSRASIEDRQIIASQCAAALHDFTDPSNGGAALGETELRDLREVVEGLEGLALREAADSVSRGVRGMATRMVEAGALSTAYTTVAHAREVVVCAAERERGLLASDQAMIARLLGDLETAEELYSASEEIGRVAADFAVLARANVGRGVISRMRGNYPQSRICFERALELAETARATDLVRLAQQGLTICFAIARDFDRALQHAWAVFQLSRGDATREAEALSNLAQISLDSGFPRAALRGFAAVLARTDSLRVCLGVLGGAAVAAAEAGDAAVLDRVAAETDRRVLHSALPYENAQALYHLAVAFATIGDGVRSDAYLARVRRLAKARGFFELLHKADRQKLTRTSGEAGPHELSLTSQNVVASLLSMDVGGAAEVLAISRSG